MTGVCLWRYWGRGRQVRSYRNQLPLFLLGTPGFYEVVASETTISARIFEPHDVKIPTSSSYMGYTHVPFLLHPDTQGDPQLPRLWTPYFIVQVFREAVPSGDTCSHGDSAVAFCPVVTSPVLGLTPLKPGHPVTRTGWCPLGATGFTKLKYEFVRAVEADGDQNHRNVPVREAGSPCSKCLQVPSEAGGAGRTALRPSPHFCWLAGDLCGS